MSRKRVHTLMALAVAGAGLLLSAIVGLFSYMSLTATPLHSDPADVPSVTESSPPPRWADAVDRARALVIGEVTGQNLPGASVAVGVDGTLVWAEGFGWAELDNQSPVTPDTRFKIGMASKVLTSAAVGLLLEDGRLRLDDEIQRHVPAYPEQEWPVTLRQLMAHTAGVRTDAGDEGPLREHCEQTLEGLRLFADRSLQFEPGTRYRYSNYGWILVSAAVEDAAGEPFPAFMRRRVFEPLGMDGTGLDPATEQVQDRAVFYFPRFAADPRYGLQDPNLVDYSCFAGSGGFLSTPADLVRFGLAMTRGGLLQPATVERLQANQELPPGEKTGYGLGWDLETIDLGGEPTLVAGHDGEVMGGTVASLVTLPSHGIVVAVTANVAFADTFGMAARIASVFLDASAAPATAAVHEGLLYGRVSTADGATHEGRIRWGSDEEAVWGNYFNGFKGENPWVALAPPDRPSFAVFGIAIDGWERERNVRRPFMARFGDIARIERRDNETRIVLKSGSDFLIDSGSANDMAGGLQVWDQSGRVANLTQRLIRTIEFLSAEGAGAGPCPVYGTVRTPYGDFTGFIEWNRRESVGSDELHGYAGEEELHLRFDTIRSIERRSINSSLVTMLDGRAFVLSGTREAGDERLEIYVDDPRYGRVLISWETVERADFTRGGTGLAYGDFPPGSLLTGRVTTRSGQRLTGQLVYDLDESETTDTLDAPLPGLNYTIPFGLIASIVPRATDDGGAPRAVVTLHGGEALRLERAGDLGDGHAGMLVFTTGDPTPAYVPWSDVERVELDRPAAGYPLAVRRLQ